MNKRNYTEDLLKIVDCLLNKEIEESDIIQAETSLLDYLAVTIYGANEKKNFANDFLGGFNSDKGEICPIGINIKTGIKNAAFINGVNGHYLELDDGHRKGMFHPGVPVFSALLPLALSQNISGNDLIKGILAGYEIGIRVACAMQPSHKKRGFHTTATCGTLGSAMAVAYALDYNNIQKRSTLAAAVTCSGGTLSLQDDDSEMKPINPGRAAFNGILAAEIGKTGIIGPKDPIGGERGILKLFADNIRDEYFDFNAKDKLLINTIYRKQHAACRHAHGPIDCALELMETNKIKSEDIKDIIVSTYDLAINGHNHHNINNISSAKMSIPYSVAVAINEGCANISQFSQRAIKDEKNINLTKKVKVEEDEKLTSLLPQKRGASINIITVDGKSYKEKVELPKGEPENPISYSEIRRKFEYLTTKIGYSKVDIEKIIRYTSNVHISSVDLYNWFSNYK